MEKRIIDVLKKLNVPIGNLGFPYLVTAIKAAVENDNTLRSMTKSNGIYDIVAKKHSTTISRAERSIRHGIECAFASTDEIVIRKYFGTNKGALTNRNFIAALAYEIKLEEATK